MPEIPQTDPCSECPFRVDSWKGYCGPFDNIAELLQQVHYDVRYVCHTRANAIHERDGGDFADAAEKAPTCTGALAYMMNTCKKPHDRVTRQQAESVGRRDDVFRTPMEMMQYHDGVVRVLVPPDIPRPSVRLKETKHAVPRQVRSRHKKHRG